MAALMSNEFILNNEQRNISLDLQNIKEVPLLAILTRNVSSNFIP